MSDIQERLQGLRAACAPWLLRPGATELRGIEAALLRLAEALPPCEDDVAGMAAEVMVEGLRHRGVDMVFGGAMTAAVMLEFGEPAHALMRAFVEELAEWAGEQAEASQGGGWVQ